MENILYELRPNLSKALMLSLGKVVIVAGLFIGGYYFLSSMGIFEVFNELLKSIGVDASGNFIKVSFPFGCAFVAFIVALLNYISLNKVRYVMYQDHLSIYKNFLIFQVHETNIPYWNIKSISVHQKKKDTISIEVAGVKNNAINLSCIDNANDASNKIQIIVRNFMANYYADYIKQQRIKNIAEEY